MKKERKKEKKKEKKENGFFFLIYFYSLISPNCRWLVRNSLSLLMTYCQFCKKNQKKKDVSMFFFSNVSFKDKIFVFIPSFFMNSYESKYIFQLSCCYIYWSMAPMEWFWTAVERIWGWCTTLRNLRTV